MKIAFFMEAYLEQSSGVQTLACTMAKGLRALGHTVLIVSGDPHAEESYLDGSILHCPAKASASSFGFSARRGRISQLKPFLEEFSPDLIQIMTYSEIGEAGINFAQQHQIPFIAVLHDLRDVRTGIPGNFLTQKITHSYFQSVFHKAVASAAAVAATSPVLCREASGLQPNGHVVQLPLCADSSRFRLRSSSKDGNENMRRWLHLEKKIGVLFVGRLDEESGLSELLDEWAKQISKTGNLQLIIAGDGPDAPALREKAKLAGIADQVTFAGQIPHHEIAQCYDICSAYVSASLSPTMKTPPVEAMCCGLPVILRKGCANESMIQEGQNGFIYSTFHELADLLKTLSSLDARTTGRMKELVSAASKNFTEDSLAHALADLYQTVI